MNRPLRLIFKLLETGEIAPWEAKAGPAVIPARSPPQQNRFDFT
jgi:hypothetical protein